jgi:hypothetical protein
MKGDVQILAPEVLTPPIVVPPDHDDRIGEPEIEEIAVDQKAISEGGHCLQELEEGLLDVGPGGPEMGVGEHYELVT